MEQVNNPLVHWLTQPLFRYLPTDLAAIAAAMIWGQKQYLNPQQYQIWRTTGLLHLLVLSGQNITLMVGFFNIIASRLCLKYRLLITILVALFYILIFGSEPPIVRASIMATLSSLVLYGQTTTPPLFLLFLTSGLMLIIKPEWLSSLSFQLSFSATLGILYFYPYFQQHWRFKSEWVSIFFVCLSAQILTTPLLLLNFRQTSLLTLPVNVAVAMLVEPIMLIGVIASFVGHLLPFTLPVLSLVLFGLLSLLNLIVNLAYPASVWFQLTI